MRLLNCKFVFHRFGTRNVFCLLFAFFAYFLSLVLAYPPWRQDTLTALLLELADRLRQSTPTDAYRRLQPTPTGRVAVGVVGVVCK
jgi:hypothetical protein